MKIAHLPIYLIALLFAEKAYCQITEVIVGDTAVIENFVQPRVRLEEEFCGSSSFYLINQLNTDFKYDIRFGQKSVPNIVQFGHDPDTAQISFLCNSVGIHYDSASFSSLWSCGSTGHNFWQFYDVVPHISKVIGIDSVVAIKFNNPQIILPIDTISGLFHAKSIPVYFYSNIADSVLFDSWEVLADPAAKINFKVDTNVAAISEYRSKPFTRKKQLNFIFTSNLAPTDTVSSFPISLKTRVRYMGVDSMYSNNFTVVLLSLSKTHVRTEVSNDFSFTIIPNPFSEQTTFTVTTASSKAVTLEIYDLLGNRKQIITNEDLVEGTRAYHSDVSHLVAGAYFARISCGSQITTKKLIVKK